MADADYGWFKRTHTHLSNSPNPIMKFTLPALFLTVVLSGCSSIDMPQGSSEGYSTARFVKTSYATQTGDLEDSPEVHQAIQGAIKSQFGVHGIAFGQPTAQLIVTYMLIRQSNVSTTINRDYFGQGRDASEIMDEAHRRGVIENKRPDEFDAGAIVIDILDASTNELVFRNFATGDVMENLDPAARQVRVNTIVREILEPFFAP